MRRIVNTAVMVLLVALLALVLLSWLLSATMTDGVRSLLSSEGIRWFLGGFVDRLASPWLSSILLVGVAWGCLVRSGLLACSVHGYRERVALRMAAALLVVYVGIVVLLSFIPHAVLLSASGSLFPSPFSASMVLLMTFGVVLVSSVYGLMNGNFSSLIAVCDACVWGISQCAPLLLLGMVVLQFVETLIFVFFS